MAVIDRHRVARLIELSAAERTLKGPERLLREDDVAQLVRAAFDDAAEKARVDFMARVSRAPSSAWPWSAVQVSSARGGGGLIGTPKPLLDLPPPAVLLLLGQVDSPEVDPTHRVPDRTSPEGAAWEPLFKALETWDTVTLKKWMHASGWAQPGTGAPKTDLPADTDYKKQYEHLQQTFFETLESCSAAKSQLRRQQTTTLRADRESVSEQSR